MSESLALEEPSNSKSIGSGTIAKIQWEEEYTKHKYNSKPTDNILLSKNKDLESLFWVAPVSEFCP